jgi:hypothetical protein
MNLLPRLFLLSTLGLFWPGLIQASTPTGVPALPSPELESEVETLKAISDVDASSENIKMEIRKKGVFLHRLKEGAGGAQYLWEDQNPVQPARKVVLKISEAEMKSLIRQLEVLNLRKQLLLGDLELLRLRNEEARSAQERAEANKKAKLAVKKPKFFCDNSVAEAENEKIKVLEPFGLHKDRETGLAWKNSGWWLTQLKSEVKACASGTVVFSGKIVGRGRVVLLDHGAGSMTLYANLNDDTSIKLTRGDRVLAGAPLGTVGEKLFFEVRTAGNARDPDQIFQAKHKSQFQF